LPVGLLPPGSVITDLAFALYDAPLWNMALIASRLHLVWIGTVCGKFKTDFRYSNTLGWNTFPIPMLTEQNKADLTVCAENILLAREAHFPATIADLYDPDNMPPNLRHAHERNDEVLERIYIGRRFKNDTERLEKLFELHTKITAVAAKAVPATEAARSKCTSDGPIGLPPPPEGYADWLADLKSRIYSAQLRATWAVNRELVLPYWHIGRDILAQQAEQGWGAMVIERELAGDDTSAEDSKQ
jgi:hypothetical protein